MEDKKKASRFNENPEYEGSAIETLMQYFWPFDNGLISFPWMYSE